MPINLTCPRCGAKVPLAEPLPMPGDEVKCTDCASGLAVSYPTGVMDLLKQRGKRFADGAAASPTRVPREQLMSATDMGRVPIAPPPARPARAGGPPAAALGGGHGGTFAATEIDRTTVDPTEIGEPVVDYHEIDRTVSSMRSPYGGLPNNAAEPEGNTVRPPEDLIPTRRFDDEEDSLHSEANTRRDPALSKATPHTGRGRGKIAGCMASMMGLGGIAAAAVVVGGMAAAGGGYWYFSQDLPSHEALRAYRPPTVTVVKSHDGTVLGEIFDQRRYVVPIDEIPDHVKNAFLAAEDANFYNHGGVDFMGIARAVGRNAAKGRMAQGASTITQQVARNFLLTRDKKIERKIKEVILSWRIEETYTKDHILYLYLNEIFLGSHAYGVEAASKAYFGKSVRDISVAEAAILAGLPQRPSDYSPHRHWAKSRARQEYVIGQMVAKEYITAAEGEAALAEEVRVIPPDNAFLEQAPHFTEHVRRYLVEKYGEEQVLNQGLQVTTTCDFQLQQIAQDSVAKGVFDVDQRMGFRRDAITHVAGDAAIQSKRDEHEKQLRKDWAYHQDAAGRVPEPATSILAAGEVYEGVILEVEPKWARVAIGDHEGIIPMAWSEWVYEPNPKRSWRYRTATDLTMEIDTDDDHKPDAAILQKGDVVLLKVEALSSRDKEVAKAFAKTPGETKEYLATRLWQDPEIESALLSMDVETGAIRAMIGGADFSKSQFNRAIQSRRQVGSTFKPIVYAAAIESKRVTTASMVADAPLAFATSEEFVWKPANYGDDYLGNITLRKALAMSRNTCTVRVLESMDPGMNEDVVHDFARRLGIGGAPAHTLPDDFVATPDTDVLCPWTQEHRDSTICMDHYPPRTDTDSNTKHRQNLSPNDVHMCRTCDMSMGLGSASLTMEELVRAYSAFAHAGQMVQPYYVEEVTDRDGKVLERHAATPHVQVMDPAVASITRWLLEGVVQGGTGYQASKELELKGLGGKTGTTNDEKDTWFVGFTNEVLTSVWVGYDQPRSLGVSSTGGRTALPIWIDYMRVAAPKSQDRSFGMEGDIEWAQIDEATGRRVSSGGRAYPFIRGTAPEATGLQAGQFSIEDMTTEL